MRYLTFFVLLFLASCNSNEQTAKQKIQDYLRSSLNDPDSYEPVEYSKLIDEHDNGSNQVTGYIIQHKYRAKNGFGGIVTEEEVFRFDTLMNMIGR